MRLRYKLIAVVAVVLNVFLTNCGLGSSSSGSCGIIPPVTISPVISTLAVNASHNFTATDEQPNATTWSLSNASLTNVGTLSAAIGASSTFTAPPTPPIYPQQPDPTQQGKVTLQAYLAGQCGGTAGGAISIIAPSITAGISPVSATVHLGSGLQFYGYAVGGTLNSVTFQVNGVAGGSSSTGTITNTVVNPYPGFYTAPATMPMSGNQVTITVVSQADPTRTATAVVTLQ